LFIEFSAGSKHAELARIVARLSAAVYGVIAGLLKEAIMDAAIFRESGRRVHNEWMVEYEPLLRRFPFVQHGMYLASLGIVILLFIADVSLPRGATAAIGYCVVPVTAVGARRTRFLFGIACLCSILTWAAYVIEPAGGIWWVSLFERLMVTWVVWLTVLLVSQRAAVVSALAEHAQQLEAAGNELQRSNAALQTFASAVAHDLRSPLNAIGLTAELLAEEDPVSADAERRDLIASITRQVDRMSGLIQSLLTYGRVGSGELVRVTCDCEAVLADVKRSLEADLEAQNGSITNDPMPVILADPDLMARLFQNLLENGIKYSANMEPRIHVSAAPNSTGWVFCVQDNGVGIPTADTERIFEPFRQLGGKAGQRGGVGLGLATCKRIVQRHGGELSVQSTLGMGSRFEFSIPK
jgi:signal transduction histidine kinase